MKHKKIVSFEDLLYQIDKSNLAFTNGCFDTFHAGHAHLLSSIKQLTPEGSKLIVAVNSDKSVQLNKGPSRPIIPEAQRAYLVACHESVDSVFIFDEKSVETYLRLLKPAFWCKGGDYDLSSLNPLEKDAAENTQVLFIPLLKGLSSTNIINKIKNEKIHH
jgi:rfaE bifunctional protein nucleotidyltransferase chain/domain